MNKFVIFAILAVCATATQFIPHPLPCAVQIKAKSTATIVETGDDAGETDAIFTLHGTYFREQLKYLYTAQEKKDTDILIRTDLKDPENSTVMVRKFTATLEEEDSCDDDWIDEDGVQDFINTTLSVFMETKKFDSKEKGEFQGKKYNVYSLEEQDHSLKYYTNDDDYLFVIEEVFLDPSGSGDHIHNVDIFDYDFDVSLNSFVIDKGVSSKCSEEAYKAPTDKICPNQYIFVPNTLPCAYRVDIAMTYYDGDTGDKVGNGEAFIARHSTYFNVYQNMKTLDGKTVTGIEYLIRSDFANDTNSQIAFVLYGGQWTDQKGECVEQQLTEEEGNGAIDSYSSVLTKSQEFDKKAKGEFKGKKCDVYGSGEGKNQVLYYVDEKNYLIGFQFGPYCGNPFERSARASGSSSFASSSFVSSSFVSSSSASVSISYLAELSYDFNPPLDTFVISGDFDPDCPEQAYKAPTQKLCSDTSSSMAATTKAAIAMILLSVAFALLL